MCEAVVEGMGGVWDAAEPRRHPYFETGVEEAIIAWSAPQPWHPVAKVYIANSIDRYFGFYGPGGGPAGAKAGDKKPWNFSYHDSRIYRALQRGPTAGQVVDRTKLAPTKLPSFTFERVSECERVGRSRPAPYGRGVSCGAASALRAH